MFKLKSYVHRGHNRKLNSLCVFKIKINNNVVFDIINLFEYKNMMIIVDLDKNSKLFLEFKKQNIKYDSFQLGKNNIYKETILLLPKTKLNILNDIIAENIEKLYVFINENSYDFDTKITYKEYVFWKIKANPNLYIEFIFNEDEINITYDPKKYSDIKLLISKKLNIK